MSVKFDHLVFNVTCINCTSLQRDVRLKEISNTWDTFHLVVNPILGSLNVLISNTISINSCAKFKSVILITVVKAERQGLGSRIVVTYGALFT